MKFVTFAASMVLGTSLAFAQTTTEKGTAEVGQSKAVVPANPRSGSLLDNLILGYKSQNESGRFGYANQKVSKDSYTGRTYRGKHEAKLGYKLDSGWGLYGQMTQYRYDYSDSTLNKWASGDPSVTLMHPMFLNTPDLKILGSLRYYVPNTDRSKALGVRQIAYYFDVIYKLAADEEIFNEVNPRVFGQDSYSATDTRVKVEDITVYTKKVGTWGRYGVGQWTQWEQHADSPNGTTIDVFPMFDFIFSRNVYVGPRLYMPVYVENTVYDGSRNTTWENAYLQIFLQANL